MFGIEKENSKGSFVIITRVIFVILVFLAFLYFSVIVLLPNVLNSKDYSSYLTSFIKDQTGLILIIDDYNLSVSPALEIDVKAKRADLFYPDKRQIASVKNVQASFSTIYLLKKEVKINKIKADELQFTTKLISSGKTTFQDYLDKHLRKGKSDFSLSETFPKIVVNKYLVKIKDEKTSQVFKFDGSSLKVVQKLNRFDLAVTTSGKFYCFNREYITYNIRLVVPRAIFNDVKSSFVNIPISDFKKVPFNALLNADLKISLDKKLNRHFTGTVNIDKFSIVISGRKLPPSYFHIKINDGKAVLSSEFYTNYNEVTSISANMRINKPYKAYILCKCKSADLKNLQNLALPVLNILKIKNNLSDFDVSGKVSADFVIDTNFETFKSQGSLNIYNSQVHHKSLPVNISNIVASIDFSNNNLLLKKSSMLVNGQPVKVFAKIDNQAFGDIKLSANNLDLKNLVKAFPFVKLPNSVNIKSGTITFDAIYKGKLINFSPKIYAEIDNLSISDLSLGVKAVAKNIKANLNSINNNYKGNLSLNRLNGIYENNSINTKFSSESFGVSINNNDITIMPSRLNLGSANMTVSGNVKNFSSDKRTSEIVLKGNIDTNFLKSLIPNDARNYFIAKSSLPFNLSLSFYNSELKVFAQFLADSNHYISPITINNLHNKTSMGEFRGVITKNKIRISDFGFYDVGSVKSLLNRLNSNKYNKLFSVSGDLDLLNDRLKFNNFSFKTHTPLSIKLPDFDKSSVKISASLFLNGFSDKPTCKGALSLTDLNVPELGITAYNVQTYLGDKNVSLNIKDISLKDTKLSVSATLPYDFFFNNTIDELSIAADYLDLDALLSLSDNLHKTKYSAGVDFPYVIKQGKLSVKQFKLSNIKANNVAADISSVKNTLYIKNMFSDVFGGKVAGQINYNFPFHTTNATLQGRGLNGELLSKSLLPVSQRFTGKLNFDATVSFVGNKYEQQIKTLKGKSNVLINNGHMGQLGMFEHFLYAQNLLSQRLINMSLGSAVKAIKPKDTGYVTYAKAVVRFNNGYMYLSPVLTSGPKMSMYISGNLNLLTNYADIEILGKVTSDVSDSLGLLGTITFKDFLEEHTNHSDTIMKVFNLFNSELPEMNISKIPQLTPNYGYETRNFRVLIVGNTDSVKSVKSFTWVNPAGSSKKLNLTNSRSSIQQNHTEVNTSKNNLDSNNTSVINKSDTPQKSDIPDFLNNIPDKFN